MAVALTLVAVTTGCTADDSAATRGRSTTTVAVMVDGNTVPAGRLTEAVAGLCQAREAASADPLAARSTYEQRAEYGVNITAQALEDAYSILASRITRAVAALEIDMAGERTDPGLADDLGTLGEMMREGLSRLGIATEPC